MIAYKFLRDGRIGPFSGFQWPEPGIWVRPGDTVPCNRGIHACEVRDLPWWLGDQLWEVELDGEVQRFEHKLVAAAGRLVAHVRGWTPECARDYSHACAWRARDRAAQVLAQEGHGRAVVTLAQCTTLDELLVCARELLQATASARVILGIARDGAIRALEGAAAVSAYIAAHAAARVDGIDGYSAERDWQSQWLVERLGLRAEG